jgi:hypothetical protein
MRTLSAVLKTSATALLLLPLAALAFQQTAAPGNGIDTAALVRRASQNELAPSKATTAIRYKLRKADEKGVNTKEIIETKDGNVARLISIGDKPLTPEQAQGEASRLEQLMNDPSLQDHRRKREKEDSDRADKMIKLLPDAFLYTYLGMVDGPNGPCYRLSFKPNPNFDPPDREAEVYHGMAGEMWIDKGQERLVKLDAHLIDDVNFGWGILGRLYKGGTLVVEQADVGGNHWETTHMRLNLTGKALLFKSLRFDTTEDASDFQSVAQMGYRDAIKLLQADKPQVAVR